MKRKSYLNRPFSKESTQIVKKYMKNVSVQKMQIMLIIRCPLSPVGMAIIKKKKLTKAKEIVRGHDSHNANVDRNQYSQEMELSEGCSEFQTEPQGPEVVQLDRNATVFPRTIYLHSDVHCDMIHVSRATEHT